MVSACRSIKSSRYIKSMIDSTTTANTYTKRSTTKVLFGSLQVVFSKSATLNPNASPFDDISNDLSRSTQLINEMLPPENDISVS